ncbi:MAG TPA: response regulator [Steroidobacteraceae bacterium]|nr:response regulator [Steroidobacteraceae bacterium]
MKGLLIDDDALFGRTLQRALERRGVAATTAGTVDEAMDAARATEFDFALVDLKIGKESGLKLIGPLRELRPKLRLVMMTGYGSVATAIEAIKAGADDYLLKPVSVDAILRALSPDEAQPAADEAAPESMTPLNRLEWEHIQQALRATDGNISAAARLLGIERRSLQRKLAKRPTVVRKE